MSRPFAAVESFLERILERPAARLFHAHPQPVQLERRIERAMTAHRLVRGGRTYVPSRYRIVLHPGDLAALQAASDRLPAELAEAILQRARGQGYWFLARPEVLLVPSTRITQGDLEVDAEPLDPGVVNSAAAGLRPVELEGPRPPRPPIPGTGVVPDPSPDSLPPLVPVVVAVPAGASWAPMEDVVLATIGIHVHGEESRLVAFRGGTLRVGRGTDNDIMLPDDRVSRHHGRFTSRQGVMVYTDLDSTNGSLVNGTRVREAGLGVGDSVRVGRATLTVLPPA